MFGNLLSAARDDLAQRFKKSIFRVAKNYMNTFKLVLEFLLVLDLLEEQNDCNIQCVPGLIGHGVTPLFKFFFKKGTLYEKFCFAWN